MLSGSWVYGALTFLVSILVYERISVYEEEFLREEFGEAHSKWAENVPFLMPRLHGWEKPNIRSGCVAASNARKKKLVSLATAIALCDFAQRGFDPSRLPDNMIWYYIWAGALLAYMISRGLRYYTKTYDGIQ